MLVTPGIAFAPLPSNGQAFSPNPYSIILEAYRTLRTAILLSRASEPPKTILFTSGTPGEGKSVTVLNTAIVLAQMGAQVLLIDADLRRPTCHELLGLRNKLGLTELLTGQKEFDELVQSPSKLQLSFLSGGGSIPPDPAELLGSQKMRETLVLLQKQFDYILIDAPPVMPVSDALLLSTLVDGVILVVNSQKTPRYVVKETQTRLDYVQAKILGVVLNKIDMQTSTYAYYYGDYVSYYPTVEEKGKEKFTEISEASRNRNPEC
jgi:capsular exopolysaccharide synthesis family protein